jgi:hypothetical protein
MAGTSCHVKKNNIQVVYMHMRLNVNGVLKYFLREENHNRITETNVVG